MGNIPVPRVGQSLLQLVVAIAGPELAKRANLEQCTFESYPAEVGPGGTITVTGSAFCMLRGTKIVETLRIILAPIAPAPS